MKKVCLVTSEESFLTNFGAALQGYALSNFIENLGYDVKILRYIGGQFPESIENKRTISDILKKYSLHELYIKILFRVGKKIHAKDIKIQRELFQEFQDEYMSFYPGNRIGWNTLKDNIPTADIFVCGSDQIWNPMFKNGYNDPGFFLTFVKNKKKIAYAPSFGVSDIPKTAQSNLKQLLDDFDYISVREQAGANILAKYAGINAEVVLDPTLLYTKEEWSKIIRLPANTPDKYILCYRFGNSTETNKVIKDIENRYKLPVITLPLSGISYMDKSKNLFFNVGPQEFIGLIKNAALVCTDSFHATVFSLLMETPFITFLRDSDATKGEGMNSRILNLLEKTELTERIFNKDFSIDKDSLFNIDFSKANEKLNVERTQSIKWLKNGLGIEVK